MEYSKVVLIGGPEYFPADARVREVADLTDKVKVAFGAGYEHFLPSDETFVVDGEHLPVFRWCGATRIAE
jgi:Family of unknown function (DUF5988)